MNYKKYCILFFYTLITFLSTSLKAHPLSDILYRTLKASQLAPIFYIESLAVQHAEDTPYINGGSKIPINIALAANSFLSYLISMSIHYTTAQNIWSKEHFNQAHWDASVQVFFDCAVFLCTDIISRDYTSNPNTDASTPSIEDTENTKENDSNDEYTTTYIHDDFHCMQIRRYKPIDECTKTNQTRYKANKLVHPPKFNPRYR